MKNQHFRQFLNLLIWGIILVGLSGTFPLVQSDFREGNICPKIMGIPACYIILSCLAFAIVSHTNLFKDKNRLYFIGVLTALSIATIGTIGNIFGYVECPKTMDGTPLCYLSFVLFSSLLITKWGLLKTRPTSDNNSRKKP